MKYLSEDWWELVAQVLTPSDERTYDLAVAHCINSARTTTYHYQYFSDNVLGEWSVRPPERPPDLTLYRDMTTDMADFLGRANPSTVANSSTLAVPISANREVRTDILGISDILDGFGKALPCSDVLCRFLIGDAPFGRVHALVKCHEGRLSRPVFAESLVESQVAIEIAYSEMIAWLHDELRLATIIGRGTPFEGSVYDVSHTVGVLSRARSGPSAGEQSSISLALRKYAAARSDSLQLFDAIEDSLPSSESIDARAVNADA